jgi:hypothetical protein
VNEHREIREIREINKQDGQEDREDRQVTVSPAAVGREPRVYDPR